MSKFRGTNMRKLKTFLKGLKNRTGCEDGINTMVVKDSFRIIDNRYLDVINTLLQEGVFSVDWKISVVVPVSKGKGH